MDENNQIKYELVFEDGKKYPISKEYFETVVEWNTIVDNKLQKWSEEYTKSKEIITK